MTFNQFINLSDTDQELVVWSEGVPIGERENKEFEYVLYQVDGFYIEMLYSNPYRMLKGFRAFNDVEYLAPYLDAVNIESLYR